MKTRIISQENTMPGCHESLLSKNRTMNETTNHPQLEMLVGLLLVDGLFLLATMVVVIGLQEVMVAILWEVVITNF